MSEQSAKCPLRTFSLAFMQGQSEATADAQVTGGYVPSFPVLARKPLAPEERAANERAVGNIIRYLRAKQYNLTCEEHTALTTMDATGRVGACLIVDSYPVNASDPWLDKNGSGLAQSMMPHALQLDSLGLLDLDNQFVRLDIHAKAMPASAGIDGNLDKSMMREMARCTMRL